MAAATPLHVLLLEAAGRPLVMTSGNVSDEPIATGNDEALRRLGGVADLFLMHDREIVARYDDSVVRDGPAGPVMLRRARGYAPLPLPLPVVAPVLAGSGQPWLDGLDEPLTAVRMSTRRVGDDAVFEAYLAEP